MWWHVNALAKRDIKTRELVSRITRIARVTVASALWFLPTTTASTSRPLPSRQRILDCITAHIFSFFLTMNADEEPLTPQLMLAFYRRLYPFKSIFQWLNHEHTPTKLFMNREFAFTLQGDVYLRYQSFATADDLKKQVLAQNPTRFEIGPMYTVRVSNTP